MSQALIIQAALELVRVLIGGAVAFAKAANVPQDKIDAALAKELETFRNSDPSNLKIPE